VTLEAVAEYAHLCLRRDAFSLLAYGSRGVRRLRGFDFSFPSVALRG
jgi:hypothetical protein